VFDRIGEWDVLVAYDFARLTRNEEDQGWALNRLKSHRKRAVEASTGLELANIGARVMGVMNAEYREKVSKDTHRGLSGAFDRKHATGGCPFGYRTVPIIKGEDAHGHPITEGYRLEVDPERAPIIERIFTLYTQQGMGLRNLAHQLNAERLPSPSGNGWAPTAIREMLRNRIYRGERIWNRSYWVKDHETGKRRRFERPESEWVRQTDEAWRIVSDDLWEAAQVTRRKRNQRHLRDGHGRIVRTAIEGRGARRKRVLSGFLRCGECGGSFHELHGRGEWGCSWHRNRGTCDNAIRVPEERLEAAVLKAVAAALDEEVARHALGVALAELQKRLDALDPSDLDAEIQRIDMQIERAVDLAVELGDVDAVKVKLRSLREERSRASADRARTAGRIPTIDELMPVVKAKLADLRTTLERDVAQSRMVLGALLGEDRLRIYSDGRIEGAAMLEAEMKLPASSRSSKPGDTVVAGGRYARVCPMPGPLELSVEGKVAA
jgi:DNA invertase Pin-like site-specific DNA recombinase